MTELQFLIDLLLNHKLNPTTKKLVAERIGHVESNMNKPTIQVLRGTPLGQAPIQAPSTQAILDRDAEMPSATPVVAPPILASNRIIGGEVNTGKGTKGPRKF